MACKPNKPFPTQAEFFHPPQCLIIAIERKLGQTACARQCDFLELRSGVLLTPEDADRWMVGWAGSPTGLGPIRGPTLKCSQLMYKWDTHLYLEGVLRAGRDSVEICGVLSFLTRCSCNYPLHRPRVKRHSQGPGSLRAELWGEALGSQGNWEHTR